MNQAIYKFNVYINIYTGQIHSPLSTPHFRQKGTIALNAKKKILHTIVLTKPNYPSFIIVKQAVEFEFLVFLLIREELLYSVLSSSHGGPKEGKRPRSR